MKCTKCGCWVEIEEPNPTDVEGFACDECLELADFDPARDPCNWPENIR